MSFEESYEDRPCSQAHDEAALLFTHAAEILSDLDQTGHTGSMELPLSPQAIRSLRANKALDLRDVIPENTYGGALALELGYIESAQKLGILSLGIPSPAVAGPNIDALVYERAEQGDLYYPSARSLTGQLVEIEAMPAEDETYMLDVLYAAMHPLPDFSSRPPKLKSQLSNLLSRAVAYTMQRETTFPIDPVREVTVRDTISRDFFDTSGAHGAVRHLQAASNGRRNKRQHNQTKKIRPTDVRAASGFRHEQVLEITEREFGNFDIPNKPTITKSVIFTALDHEIVSTSARLEIAIAGTQLNKDVPYAEADFVADMHGELAESQIGGFRRNY